MMIKATVKSKGIEITFADACTGLVPYSVIPEVANHSELKNIELSSPYLLNITGKDGKTAELPWDFVRHYCNTGYKQQEEKIAASGRYSLGERIRTLRKNTGMTQSELAGAAGIGRVTETRIENGEQSPGYKTLLAIAGALEQPLTVLLSDAVQHSDIVAEKQEKYRVKKPKERNRKQP